MAIIRLSRLSKSFGSQTELRSQTQTRTQTQTQAQILDQIDLEVSKGESLAIKGKSGSGKSTLLNIIAGLESADSGSIEVMGHKLEKLSALEKDRLRLDQIGIIFQFFHLLPTLTLWENALLPAAAADVSAAKLKADATSLFETIGLCSKDWVKYPHEVSGGMLGRAGVVRALLKRPTILLADEPTGNLDSTSADQVLGLIMDLVKSRELTLILVTHDPDAAALCAKQISLFNGKLTASV